MIKNEGYFIGKIKRSKQISTIKILDPGRKCINWRYGSDYPSGIVIIFFAIKSCQDRSPEILSGEAIHGLQWRS